MTNLPAGPHTPSLAQFARWFFTPGPFLERCAARYGDAFTLHLPSNPPFVFFSHPAAVKEIFTGDPEDLHAGEGNRMLEPVLGKSSLLLLDGARHMRERRLMMPPFHGERMRAYGETMRDVTAQSMARWPVDGQPFSIHHEMQAITLDVILRTVFGLDEGERMTRMRELLGRFIALGASPIAAMLLMAAPLKMLQGLTRLTNGGIKLFGRRFDVSGLLPGGAVSRAKRDVDELLFDEIARRRARGAASPDVLSLLLEARDEHGQAMTDEELRDEMLTLLLAGHETSATTLAWVVHQLLEHPEVMATARAEVARVAGDAPIAPDRVGELEYVDAVIKETMRLTPVIGLVARRLKRPMTIGGYDLPADVVAVPCIYLTHRRADLWPDPQRFDPTRFIGQRTDPYHFFPWGGGTRRCLGLAFASYEMKIVLAEVLRAMELRAAPGSRVHMVRRSITFAPSGGTPVLAARRPRESMLTVS